MSLRHYLVKKGDKYWNFEAKKWGIPTFFDLKKYTTNIGNDAREIAEYYIGAELYWIEYGKENDIRSNEG